MLSSIHRNIKIKDLMKKSIAFLPSKVQEDLKYPTSEIRKRLPQAEMIILFGSYARDKYVRRDITQRICLIKIKEYEEEE